MLKVSVIILAFDSIRFVKPCLDSVFSQDYLGLEAIVVDNGSRDGTAGFIKKNYPEAVLIENKANFGVCKARNQGIKISKGEWILTLDCDIVLEKAFINKLMALADGLDSSTGIIQPKILKDGGKKIYSCGIRLSRIRRFYDIGNDRFDNAKLNTARYVFGACSAAALYRRRMLEEIKEDTGYFDERFFFLVEDVDLAWRAQRKGWRAFFYPEAVCCHSGDSSRTPRKTRQYLCFRNRHFMIAKNENHISLHKLAYRLIAYDIARTFYLLFTNRFTIKALKEATNFSQTV